MKDEPPSRLDWSTVVYGAVRSFSGIDIELLEERTEPHPCSLLANPDPDRSILVMHTKGNHRALKSRVSHPGHCEKQLA